MSSPAFNISRLPRALALLFLLVPHNAEPVQAAPGFEVDPGGGSRVCEGSFDGGIPAIGLGPMSDWIDVRNAAQSAAGDGEADDTAAIQAALDRLGEGLKDPKVAYLPPGRYRITRTLVSPSMQGAMVLGAGRDTVIEWDGPPGGVMFHSNGMSRSTFKGIVWDGKERALVGIDHRSAAIYETRVIHKYMVFRNFTGAAIRTGKDQKTASAEMMFYDLIFENNAIGAQFLAWNDYNNVFDGCHFQDNDFGVHAERGNVIVRNSRFDRSRKSDLRLSTHSHSVRRVVSSGSHRFIETVRGPNAVGMVKIQDVVVENWKSAAGAIVSSLRGPLIVSNARFSGRPRGGGAPIRLDNPGYMRQSVILSTVTMEGGGEVLDPGPNARVSLLEAMNGGVLSGPEHVFLNSTVAVPATVIDARADCDARGDGRHNDTVALRQCVERAAAAGAGTLLYLPAGVYPVSGTVAIERGSFAFAGAGWHSRIEWRGKPGGTVIEIRDPQRLRVQNLRVTGASGTTTIRQTGTSEGRVDYDNVFAAALDPANPGGVVLDNLPAGAIVGGDHLDGRLTVLGGGSAYVLPRVLMGRHFGVRGSGDDVAAPSGLIGAAAFVSCCSDTQLSLSDGRSVVISDWYSEQGDTLFDIRGDGLNGQVTLDFAKAESVTPHIGSLTDYGGRLTIVGGMFGNARDKRIRNLRISGDLPPAVSFLGSMFWHSAPSSELESSRQIFVGSTVQDKSRPSEVIEDRTFENWEPVRQGLADLLRLGQVDVWMKYCDD